MRKTIVMLMTLALTAGIAYAQDPAPPTPTPDDPGAFIEALLTAAREMRWLSVAALVLFGLVWLARRNRGWLVKKWPLLGTERGGAVLVLVLAFLADVAMSLAAGGNGAPTGVGALLAALAAGGRAILKALVTPKDVPPPVPKAR